MNYDDMSKDARKYTEIKRLNNLFKKMDSNTRKLVKALIENAAFMTITLQDLDKDITIKGYTEEYQNGENQFGTKKSTEMELYNTTIKNFSSIMKQLCDLLPKAEIVDKSDGFDKFVGGRND